MIILNVEQIIENITYFEFVYVDGESYLRLRTEDTFYSLFIENSNDPTKSLIFPYLTYDDLPSRVLIGRKEYNAIISTLEDKENKSISELTLGQFGYLPE